MHSTVSTRISYELNDEAWDAFLAGCPNGHHEQTSMWGRVKKAHGNWEPVRLIQEAHGQIVGGAQILIKRVGRYGSVGYISKGPVLAAPTEASCRRIAEEVKELGRSLKLSYLVNEFPYEGEGLAASYDQLGFLRHPHSIPPTHLMEATTFLDLSQPLEKLMASCRTTLRANIRNSFKKGLVVRAAEEHEVPVFWKLMCQLCERRGISPNPAYREFFESLWKAFTPAGALRIFLASVEGETIAGMLVFKFGGWARVWRIGWSGQFPKHHPNEALWWKSIEWAKAEGCNFFDFVWLPRESAEAHLLGQPIPPGPWLGVSEFKIGFGGKVILLQPARSFAYQPLLRCFLRARGERLLESKLGERLLGRAFRRLNG